MKNKKKIYAFIDSQNLNLGVLSSGWKLDFHKFRVFLKDKYNVEKAYLFIGHVSGNEKLYTFLQEAGYIIIFKPTLEFKKNKRKHIKGNVDAELVLHAMLHFGEYEGAIIVSGDGDFHCLVEHLDEAGKLEKIIVPNSQFSSLLRKFASKIVPIDKFKHKIEE